MKLTIFQVDAFADRLFAGNPAAVVPLEDWLPDALLQSIAQENNLSETAFFVQQDNVCSLRWFTPEAEVDLCGHATLASAHVLFEHLGFAGPEIQFQTRSGDLRVKRAEQGLSMDFPAVPSTPIEAPEDLIVGLGARPELVREAPDYLAVFANEKQIRDLKPDFNVLARLDRRGVIATAPGESFDFVSRCFYPKLGVNEDPVTGSAHCKMAPYWADRLDKTRLHARQLSRRGGNVVCQLRAGRVMLTGTAITYLTGTLNLATQDG
jgi:PhzF family phenazine biosynthesis protein